MSCGKPIVATRIPGSGVPWVNEDGVSGRNATPCDVSSLTQAILDVDANRESMGAGAYKRYQTMFTREMMLKNILKVYEELS
jgi:rhamnosyl/mannosyltransferase